MASFYSLFYYSAWHFLGWWHFNFHGGLSANETNPAFANTAAVGGFCVWRRVLLCWPSGRRWKAKKRGQAVVGVEEWWNFAMRGSKAS
jgi:hypothetical protein